MKTQSAKPKPKPKPKSKPKRHYRSVEQWQSLVDDHARSGLSQSEFCRQHGLTQSALFNWRRRLAAPARKPQLASPFIEISPPVANTQHWDVELELGGGRILRVRVS